jgi:hypothetical protein
LWDDSFHVVHIEPPSVEQCENDRVIREAVKEQCLDGLRALSDVEPDFVCIECQTSIGISTRVKLPSQPDVGFTPIGKLGGSMRENAIIVGQQSSTGHKRTTISESPTP